MTSPRTKLASERTHRSAALSALLVLTLAACDGGSDPGKLPTEFTWDAGAQDAAMDGQLADPDACTTDCLDAESPVDGSTPGADAQRDAEPPQGTDAGPDASTQGADAGADASTQGGTDAGSDAGHTSDDAGGASEDAGVDAGVDTTDAGSDASVDAGSNNQSDGGVPASGPCPASYECQESGAFSETMGGDGYCHTSDSLFPPSCSTAQDCLADGLPNAQCLDVPFAGRVCVQLCEPGATPDAGASDDGGSDSLCGGPYTCVENPLLSLIGYEDGTAVCQDVAANFPPTCSTQQDCAEEEMPDATCTAVPVIGSVCLQFCR